jgi:hypothetical protein
MRKFAKVIDIRDKQVLALIEFSHGVGFHLVLYTQYEDGRVIEASNPLMSWEDCVINLATIGEQQAHDFLIACDNLRKQHKLYGFGLSTFGIKHIRPTKEQEKSKIITA